MNLEDIICAICKNLMGRYSDTLVAQKYPIVAELTRFEMESSLFFCNNCSDAEVEAYLLRLQKRKNACSQI